MRGLNSASKPRMGTADKRIVAAGSSRLMDPEKKASWAGYGGV